MGARPACVVVGGSGTVGRAVCEALAARGARVGLTFHRNEAAARALEARLDGAVARRLDVTDPAAIERVLRELAAELGGLDALVHAAAVPSAAAIETYDTLADLDPAALRRLFAVNVESALFCAKTLDALASGGGARPSALVLLGSADGVKPLPSAVAYAASKGALRAMASGLAKELGPKGVRVNVVAPGILDGGLTRVVPDGVRAEYLKHSALKRYGAAAEVARIVTWLCLDDTYVTGQAIPVDGGL
jgi:NAD(P)-dependent dehydrogenase (short-subunit alcohol dehydrogenase family)